MKRFLPVLLLGGTVWAHSAPVAIDSVAVPGPVRWDYVSVDAQSQRVYVAHSDRVEVIDARTRKPVLQLTPTPGVHGAAAAPDVGRVFTSDGAADEVGVFDIQSGRLIRTVKVGQHPDAIVYDAATQRVFAFNGRSNDVTAVDAKTLEVLASSIPAGGRPEYAVSDGKGLVYFNIEDNSELAVLDARSLSVLRRFSLAPCEEPSGLAIDPGERLYSVCRNKLMVVSDPSMGRVLGHVGIGAGAESGAVPKRADPTDPARRPDRGRRSSVARTVFGNRGLPAPAPEDRRSAAQARGDPWHLPNPGRAASGHTLKVLVRPA